MNTLNWIFLNMVQPPLLVIAIGFCLYIVPYLIRKGWKDADNDTMKVCSTCWRDIKKVDEALKKAKII